MSHASPLAFRILAACSGILHSHVDELGNSLKMSLWLSTQKAGSFVEKNQWSNIGLILKLCFIHNCVDKPLMWTTPVQKKKVVNSQFTFHRGGTYQHWRTLIILFICGQLQAVRRMEYF